jgi:NitT/TauT family transport system permease protein
MANVVTPRRGVRAAKLLPFVLLAIVWELATRAAILNPVFVSSPSALIGATADWYFTGRILPHLGRTLVELMVGLVLACALGVVTGIVLAWYGRLGAATTPVLVVLDAVPIVAFAPVLPLLFGIGPWTPIVLIFFLTVLPTVFGVMAGMRTVPDPLVRMARHFGARDAQVFRTVVAPAILPYIVGALRVSIGRGLAGALVGEWMGSNRGLGTMLFDAAGAFEVKTVYVGALTAMIVSVALTAAVRALDTRLGAWRPA